MAAVASKTVGFADEVSFADTPDVFGRGCRYAVGGGGDLKVTAGGAGSRSITVAAGKAWGDAVIAEHSTSTVLNATENAGSAIRWDTLVERRDWEADSGAGRATLTLLAGGASQTLAPAVQLRNPTPTTGAGFTYADQPIALVGVPVGVTTISAANIIDLRVWSGEGGGLYARHLAARSYIGSPGTSVRIGDELHTRVLDSSGSPIWERADLFAIGQARFDATGTMTAGLIPRANLELPRTGRSGDYAPEFVGDSFTATRRYFGLALPVKPFAREFTAEIFGYIEISDGNSWRVDVQLVDSGTPNNLAVGEANTFATKKIDNVADDGRGWSIDMSVSWTVNAGEAKMVRVWLRRVSGNDGLRIADEAGYAFRARWTEIAGNDW